jgi:hypothetical protein
MESFAPINVIFDGPPGPEGGRFIEIETDDGRSICIGEWSRRHDGNWALRIVALPHATSTPMPVLPRQTCLVCCVLAGGHVPGFTDRAIYKATACVEGPDWSITDDNGVERVIQLNVPCPHLRMKGPLSLWTCGYWSQFKG